MSERKNKSLKNQPKEKEATPEVKTVKSAKKEAVPAARKNYFATITHFLKDERTHKVSGAVLLLFSAYLLLALTSYLFTWQNDQDKVMGSWWAFIGNNDVRAENWLGKLGAIVSHQFIYNWFGVASFIFCFIF